MTRSKPAPKPRRAAKSPVSRPAAKPARRASSSTPARSKATPSPRASSADAAGIAYVDGAVLPLAGARISLLDRGYLLGDGIFETMRTANAKVFRLDDHALRLRRGLRAIGLDESLETDFRSAVETLRAAATRRFGGEVYLRVNVTTGPMEDVLETGRGFSVTGIARKFKPYPLQYYAQGVDLIVSKQRKDSRSPLSSVKPLSYLTHMAARREAHAAAAHDGILLNEEDRVAEASTSNLFAVKDGTFYAPGAAEGAVPGVTRQAVLGLLSQMDATVREPLSLRTLRSADEVFLTNTTGGIVPVRRVADRLIADGVKGEHTTHLMHALEAEIRSTRSST